MSVKRLIASETAGAIRRLAGAQPTTSEHDRERDLRVVALAGVFNVDEDLRVEERSNARASCRECGGPLGVGTFAVAFAFDPFYADTGGQAWGSLARAYIHAAPCQKEGTSCQ